MYMYRFRIQDKEMGGWGLRYGTCYEVRVSKSTWDSQLHTETRDRYEETNRYEQKQSDVREGSI